MFKGNFYLLKRKKMGNCYDKTRIIKAATAYINNLNAIRAKQKKLLINKHLHRFEKIRLFLHIKPKTLATAIAEAKRSDDWEHTELYARFEYEKIKLIKDAAELCIGDYVYLTSEEFSDIKPYL
jgi:hypothetical protein